MKRSRAGFGAGVIVAVLASGMLTAAPASSRSGLQAPGFPPAEPSLTALAANVIDRPSPVLGTDKRRHLVYEIEVLNVTPAQVRIDRLVVGDPVRRKEIVRYAGEAITPLMTLDGTNASSRTLEPGQGGVIFLDVQLSKRARIPERLAHRFVTTLTGEGFPPQLTMTGAETKVSGRPPVRLSPPLRGVRLFNGNGCCGASPHTRALLTIDGRRFLSQRFAIDWVRFDRSGRWVVGDPRENENYPIFGNDVIAAAPGRVVATREDLPENTPPTPLANLNAQNALGNHVIQALGGGRFALYAHLQPGSVKVSVGDRVRRGQLLGSAGNTGSSTAPHLHFHVTAAASVLESDGVPYVFDRFRYRGTVANFEEVTDETDDIFPPAQIAAPPPPRRRHRQLPLTGDVISVVPRG